MKPIELKPIKESSSDYEAIERKIISLLRREIFLPILRDLALPGKALKNSIDDVMEAIRSGRIVYGDGVFLGRFTGAISRELKRMGAIWDLTRNGWRIPESQLTPDIKIAIATGNSRFERKLEKVNRTLESINPEEISERLTIYSDFDRAIGKVESEFRKSVRKISIAPKLTPEMRDKIAIEWQGNMRLWIKKFAENQITKLRSDIQASTFAGNRYESAVKYIQDSYGVSQNKAKFLARQETNLLMTTYKQSRYQDAGINEYKWKCSAGSSRHPVRPAHKALQDKFFRFDDPPITSEAGEAIRRNNPGQDFNCRCFALPVVRRDR